MHLASAVRPAANLGTYLTHGVRGACSVLAAFEPETSLLPGLLHQMTVHLQETSARALWLLD